MRLVLERRYKDTVEFASILDQVRAYASVDVVIGSDEGYLQEDEMSPYRYFVTKESCYLHKRKSLFYNSLKIPEFWAIYASGLDGEIVSDGVKQATIYFTDPIKMRNVRVVAWQTEDGWVYKKDYYDAYGMKYFSEFFSREGMIESRSFYSDQNKEVIVEQYQNETITLMESGKVTRIFPSYCEFIQYYLNQINWNVLR